MDGSCVAEAAEGVRFAFATAPSGASYVVAQMPPRRMPR